MQRRKVLLASVVAATVAVAASSAWPQAKPTVTITDLTDGLPTLDVAGLEPRGTQPLTRLLPEEALITGLVRVQGAGLVAGTRGVFLTEPAVDPYGNRVSDWLTLTVGQITQDPLGGLPFQTVDIDFQSDGAANFDQNVRNLGNLPSLPEDGTLQDLTAVLNSGYLTIEAQSDYDSSEVPDGGSTGVLLGLVVLALTWFGRRANRR